MRRRDGEVKLPGTTVAFRAGIARLPKADLICRAAELLDAGGGRAAEEPVPAKPGWAAYSGWAVVRDYPRRHGRGPG
jgi:hypothetical protein